jgi:ATP-dependent Clp protease ATP-binding subunit ClpC
MLHAKEVNAEHVLLGLIREGSGLAAKVLESLGISQETVRQRVEEVIGRGAETPSGRIPFSAQAKRVMELTLQESRDLGHHYVGTEHILLGLIRQGDGVAARVLSELGADLDGARAQVIRILEEYRRDHGDQTG